MGHDLLGSKGDPGGVLGGQGQGFVVAVGVQALGPAEHSGQGLEGYPGDVDLRLLGGERHPGGLGVEAELQGPLVKRAVAVAHPAGPNASGGSEFADLLKEVGVAIEEERQPGGEGVHVQSGSHRGFYVGEAVGQGEGKFVGRG